MALAGCSSTAPEDQVIRVFNETGSVIYFLAMEREFSYRVDPNPAFPYTPGDIPVLQPGASVKLQLEDISGEFSVGQDLVLFVYHVADGWAELATILPVSAEELSAHNYRIEISES